MLGRAAAAQWAVAANHADFGALGVSVALSAPEPLRTQHQIGDFSSGVTSLGEWLKRRALAKQASGAARTFVV
jgi:hypothetical protein